MKKPASAFSCVLMCVLVVPVSLLGQNSAGQNPNWVSPSAVQPGAKIVVKMKDGETFKGEFNSVSENSLSLSGSGKTVDLQKDKISTIWRVSRSLKKPVLIGTAIGAGSGAILGAAAGGCNSNDFICFDRKATIPAGAVVFGVVGAVSGLAVGLLHHHRVVVYQASH